MDIKIIKREVVYSSCLFISVFFFNFLTVHHKKFTLSDFHQEVAFNQYFYLYQEFMFLCAFCLIVCFWYLDYSRTNFIKIFVGRTWSKELVTNFWERPGSYFGYKKIMNFHRSHFNVF